jgi:hypothetical protein
MALQVNWSININTMGSDHLPIVLKINEPIDTDEGPGPRWNLDKVDWDKYATEVECKVTADRKRSAVTLAKTKGKPLADANWKYKELVEIISSRADKAIPLTKPNPNSHHKLPFWNSEIKQALRNRTKSYNK